MAKDHLIFCQTPTGVTEEELAEVDRILARCPALGITELEPMVRFLAAEMSLDAEEVLAEAKAIMEGRR